jgi:hypothetical protein
MPKSKRAKYDPSSKQLQPLAILSRQIPNREGGVGINIATIWRWSMKGLKGRKLRTLSVGGISMSCGAWLAQFFDEVTAISRGGHAPVVIAPILRQPRR